MVLGIEILAARHSFLATISQPLVMIFAPIRPLKEFLMCQIAQISSVCHVVTIIMHLRNASRMGQLIGDKSTVISQTGIHQQQNAAGKVKRNEMTLITISKVRDLDAV